MEILFIVVGIILIAGIAALIFLQLRKQSPQENSQVEMLAREVREQNAELLRFTRQESASLRQEVSATLRDNTDVVFRQLGQVEKQMQSTTENLAQNMKQTNDVVHAQLAGVQNQIQATTEQVNKQLESVTRQVQESTSQVGNRLDGAAKVIGDLQKDFGAFQETSVQLKELHTLLSAPKLRGGFGEWMLEEILKQVLPPGSYDMQYRFKSGDIVDAVIRTASHLISIDAKFPYENFKKYAEAQDDAEKKSFKREFDKNVRKHIDDIAKKYILPDEGTFEFALMYIPAENIYYEIIIKDEQFADGKGIFNYATERKVVPVSPNNLYAYLQVIALGLKGLQIEKNAKMIQENLARLLIELKKFDESYAKVGTHLENAKKQYDESDKRLNVFENKLSLAAGSDVDESPTLKLMGE